jgi:hypothetical protein
MVLGGRGPFSASVGHADRHKKVHAACVGPDSAARLAACSNTGSGTMPQRTLAQPAAVPQGSQARPPACTPAALPQATAIPAKQAPQAPVYAPQPQQAPAYQPPAPQGAQAPYGQPAMPPPGTVPVWAGPK